MVHTLSPPWLYCEGLVAHLLAVCASRGKPALVAGDAVVEVLVWDEGLGTDRLLTAVTQETVLMPGGSSVLKLPGA